MKRRGNFYHLIYNRGNLLTAHNNAKKNKSHYSEVIYVEKNKEQCLNSIQKLLKEESYILSKKDYRHLKILDKDKERDLYKLSYYPHRIIQWAIINVIGKDIIKSLIIDTYASIKGRGIHKLAKKLKGVLANDSEGTRYCLKIDIRKYYDNIDNEILYKTVKSKFKDKQFLNLIKTIIFSRGEKGQPIGSLLSQYMANLYLSVFDHMCKEKLGLKYYFRYMDDIVVLHNNKTYLHNLKRYFDIFLREKLKLKIKDNWQVFPVDVRGIDYVGYRFFRHKTILRRGIYINARYCFSRKYMHKATYSYLGWCKHANVKRFVNKYLGGNDKCINIIEGKKK